MEMQKIYKQILQTQEYKRNIHYGKPRPGHEEGTIEAHINELNSNLERLEKKYHFNKEFYWKLKVLIVVHDLFKIDAVQNSPIESPNSHSTLGKNFLAKFTNDQDMLNILQYHDVGFAVYKKVKSTGKMDMHRIDDACALITDLNLFTFFCIIDACTLSKGREMIKWFINYVNVYDAPGRQFRFPRLEVNASYIIPGDDITDKGEW